MRAAETLAARSMFPKILMEQINIFIYQYTVQKYRYRSRCAGHSIGHREAVALISIRNHIRNP